MTISLRDYQQECVDVVLDEFRAGIYRQLAVLPTGSGKTICMAAIAEKLNKRTLLLAHRQELIDQAKDKFQLYWPQADIGICMGERNEINHQVVIGSIQSCSRPKRLERLRLEGFQVLMVDEAHHIASDSYQSVINALGFNSDPEKLLLGVTATAQRSDKIGLGDTFEKITYSRSISTMIRSGYLSPIIGRKILTSFVLDKIRTQNGDFVIEDLAEIVNTAERNQFVVSKFKEYAPDRKAIAFCCDVKHSQDLANAFKSLNIEASAVWGDMDTLERKKALEAFKNGQIQVLTSCNVLCEGYDEPSVNAILMARPTRSSALYTQCVGRGLRKHPSKENCIVLDFSDKHHTLDGVMSLSCTIPEVAHIVEEQPEGTERKEVDNRPKIEVLQECDKEFDILGCASFIWVQVRDEWSLQDDERNEIIMRPSENGYVATLYADGATRVIVSSPLPLEYCSGVCEDFARRNLRVNFADPSKPWMSADAPPTQSQRDYLEKQGGFKEGMTRGQASIAIRQIVAKKNQERRSMANEPLTTKQDYFLKGRGVNTENMNKLEAMQMISQIKKNETVKFGS